jgi:hypothetical protein
VQATVKCMLVQGVRSTLYPLIHCLSSCQLIRVRVLTESLRNGKLQSENTETVVVLSAVVCRGALNILK